MCRTAVCKKCGNTFNAEVRRGPAPHACPSCRQSICEHCGTSFTRKKRSNKSKDSNRFCDKICAGAARKAGKRKGRWAEAQELRACRAKVKPSQKMHAAVLQAMRKQFQAIASLYSLLNKYRPCLNCGGPQKDHATERTRFCSTKCSAEYEWECPCSSCGTPFSKRGVHGGGTALCIDCRAKARRQCRRYRNIASRAKKHGVARERYVRESLLERDGWQCQLCGVKLLHKWKYHKRTLIPHPKNATLDHIIAMSCGGADAPWNIQACCFACNSKKSASSKGQLRFRL
jgi:hypothetical protein